MRESFRRRNFRHKESGFGRESFVDVNINNDLELGEVNFKIWNRSTINKAFVEFSNLLAAEYENRVGTGYLYITGEIDGNIYDLGPFEFFWKKGPVLFVQIKFKYGNQEKLLPVFSRQTQEELSDFSKDFGISFRSFLLRTKPTDDEVDFDENLTDQPTDEDSIDSDKTHDLPDLSESDSSNEEEKTVFPKEDDGQFVSDKKVKNKRRKVVKPGKNRKIELHKRKSQELKKSCKEDLDILETLALKFHSNYRNADNTEFQEAYYYLSQKLIDIFNKKNEAKAVYRTLMRSGEYSVLVWFLRFTANSIEEYFNGTDKYLTGLAAYFEKNKSTQSALLRSIKSVLPNDEDMYSNLTTKGARYNTNTTARSFLEYAGTLFPEVIGKPKRSVFDTLEKDLEFIKKYLTRFNSFLDIGSGSAPITPDSYFKTIQKLIPNSKRIAMDIFYDESTPMSVGSVGSTYSKEFVISTIKELDIEVSSNPAQNMSDISDESIDMITASWSFDKFKESVSGTKQALREVARVLAPGGFFRCMPMNFNEDISTFLHKEMEDVFEIKILSMDSVDGYNWSEPGVGTCFVVLKKKQIDQEKLNNLKSDSKEWIKKYLK